MLLYLSLIAFPMQAMQLPELSQYGLRGYAPPGSVHEPEIHVLARSSIHRLYVAPGGADENPGSVWQPFRTLARADRAAVPGTTVYVAPGVYEGGFQTRSSGSAGARIVYISSTRWGARIVPPAQGSRHAAWDNRASNVDIVGFDVDGSAHQTGTRWRHGIYSSGSYNTIRRNRVHHIARDIACTSAGGSAIGIDGYYRGVESEVLGNLVHDIGPPGCRFVQGIYVSTSAQVKYNVVYRVSEGAIHLWHDARNVVIANNTVSASNTGIIVGGGDFYHARGPNDHTVVVNNIVYDNAVGISEQGATGKNNRYRYNLVAYNRKMNWQLKRGMRHEKTISADPRLLGDARSGMADLRPAQGSPALGRGHPQFAEGSDFEGRPRSGAVDIGAYQR